MTIPFRLEDRAGAQPARGLILHEYLRTSPDVSESTCRLELSTPDLAFRIFAAFRAHPHISNVLTHISGAKWAEVEKSLNRILDFATTSDGLSPLEENIIELMVGERGITGRILNPHFLAALRRILGPSQAERMTRHVNTLSLELEWKVQHRAPLQSEPSRSQPMSEASLSERAINVAEIDPQYRHEILFRLFEHLPPDESLQIIVNHDPRRMARAPAPSPRRR